MVAVAAPGYGLPEVQRPIGVLAILLLGSAMMLTLGIALGLAVRSVRVANAVGMLVFFPMFILGGGGPPAAVMTPTMRDIADVLPLTHITEGMREAWLYDRDPGQQLWWVVGWWFVALLMVLAAVRFRRRAD